MIAARKPIPEARRSETRRRATCKPGNASQARRDAEAAYVFNRGGLVPWVEVLSALGLNSKENRASADLVALLRAKRLHGRRIDGVYMVTRDPARLPPINLTLPMLQVGAGDRRDDCRHAADCLSRLVVARPKVTACHCPAACSSYAAVEQHERIGMATRCQSGLAAAQGRGVDG